MYLEEKIDKLLLEQKRLVEIVELFLPNLETEKGVIHFLEITKATFNTYMKDEVLQEDLHYKKQKNKCIFIPEAIIKLKKSGVKGRHKQSSNIRSSKCQTWYNPRVQTCRIKDLQWV